MIIDVTDLRLVYSKKQIILSQGKLEVFIIHAVLYTVFPFEEPPTTPVIVNCKTDGQRNTNIMI